MSYKAVNIEVGINDIIDRLRIVHQNLTERNEHTDAFIVSAAIEALRIQADEMPISASNPTVVHELIND